MYRFDQTALECRFYHLVFTLLLCCCCFYLLLLHFNFNLIISIFFFTFCLLCVNNQKTHPTWMDGKMKNCMAVNTQHLHPLLNTTLPSGEGHYCSGNMLNYSITTSSFTTGYKVSQENHRKWVCVYVLMMHAYNGCVFICVSWSWPTLDYLPIQNQQ